MQQTRLETDALALGMAKEADSAGVATVRTREGKMAAGLRGAVPPVPGRATEPAPCGKDGLETNLGAAPAGGAPGPRPFVPDGPSGRADKSANPGVTT
jgi:hypothetical protein